MKWRNTKKCVDTACDQKSSEGGVVDTRWETAVTKQVTPDEFAELESSDNSSTQAPFNVCVLALPIVLHVVSCRHSLRDIQISVLLHWMLKVRSGRVLSLKKIWLPCDHRVSSVNLEFS